MNKVKVKEIEKRWLSNKEAQKYLGVTSEYMKNHRKNADLPYFKRGGVVWYDIKVLDRFVMEGKVI